MLALILSALAVQAPVDLIVTNAEIWGHPEADTLAVSGGRFSFIGSGMDRFARSGATVIDAGGKTVLPGIIDSHAHLTRRGITLLQLQLREASSKEDFVRRVGEWSRTLPEGKWLVGRGWSAESWPGNEQPTKEWLDGVTGNRPAYLVRMDGHSALANSAALRAAGIGRDTPNPPGGVIDKDPRTGEPTGMVRETAMSRIPVPAMTEEDYYEGFLRAIRNANENGITAVADITDKPLLPLLAKYFATENPTIRAAIYVGVDGAWEDEIAAAKGFAPRHGWAEARGLKAYMDGSLGSRTAFMNQPFTKPLPDQKELRGVPMPGALDGTYAIGIKSAAEAGLQVIAHAIGDQANHDVLELYRSNVTDLSSRRFRVEHVQHLLPEDIPRFGLLGVIPSMQPYHKADDGRYCEEVIGTERSRSSYTFNSLLRGGAMLAFGSDWPVVTINPFLGLDTAVNARIMTGQVWMPHESITLKQAIDCYTTNAAHAIGWEKEVGRIARGYRADFLILDRPLTAETVAETRPLMVYVEGRKVYGR